MENGVKIWMREDGTTHICHCWEWEWLIRGRKDIKDHTSYINNYWVSPEQTRKDIALIKENKAKREERAKRRKEESLHKPKEFWRRQGCTPLWQLLKQHGRLDAWLEGRYGREHLLSTTQRNDIEQMQLKHIKRGIQREEERVKAEQVRKERARQINFPQNLIGLEVECLGQHQWQSMVGDSYYCDLIKFVLDGSVSGIRQIGYEWQIGPVEIDDMMRGINLIDWSYFSVNHTCGLHIHIGDTPIHRRRAQEMINALMIIHMGAGTSAVTGRDPNQYCVPAEKLKQSHSHNVCLSNAHKSIELRMFQSTVHPAAIKLRCISTWRYFQGLITIEEWIERNRYATTLSNRR